MTKILILRSDEVLYDSHMTGKTAARGGKLFPFVEGERGRKVKLFNPISDFRKPNPPWLKA
jgi:hypothetical protein